VRSEVRWREKSERGMAADRDIAMFIYYLPPLAAMPPRLLIRCAAIRFLPRCAARCFDAHLPATPFLRLLNADARHAAYAPDTRTADV